jgi:hypothetical protein
MRSGLGRSWCVVVAAGGVAQGSAGARVELQPGRNLPGNVWMPATPPQPRR